MRVVSWSILGMIAVTAGAFAQGRPGAPPAGVVTVPVAQRQVAAEQTFVGQVVPSQRSVVGSAVDGRVVELHVNDGDAVGYMSEGNEGSRPVGQPLVQLLTETISIEIEAAKAAAELRQQELNEMLAGTRPEELTQAKARLEGTQALADYTQARLDRVRSLYERSNTVSKEEFDEALANAINARNNQIAAKAAHEMAVAGPRAEQIAQARARLVAANEEVRRLEDQRKKYTIRAPFPGQIVAKMTEVGAWLKRGDPVMEVVALDPVEIEVTVPESSIVHVRPKSQAQVRIDSLRDRVLIGEVARIIPQADLRSRAFPVKIRLPNPPAEDGSQLLKAGMLARVTLAVGPLQQALLVPKDAIVFEEGKSPKIILARNDPAAKGTVAVPVPVQLGVADGDWIQVTGELRANESVIVIGNERVQPGQPVLPTPRKVAEG